jgi:hypothetical protein
MKSAKQILGLFCIVALFFSSCLYGQSKKSGNSDNKFFKKKITLIQLGITFYGSAEFKEKFEGLTSEIDSTIRDDYFNINTGDPRPDREKYNKIVWNGNSFVYTQDAAPDQSGNSGKLTIAGTLSADGKMIEKCSVIFLGKPGTGEFAKPEFNYNLEVHNIPAADRGAFGEGVYRLWNNANDTRYNIFTSLYYSEKELKSPDTWRSSKLLSFNNEVDGIGFTLAFIFN